jgi:hypothetical protein
MGEIAYLRRHAPLALSFFAAAGLCLALTGRAGWAEEGVVAPTADELARRALPPASGSSTPGPIDVFTDARGRSCRVYERQVVIDGAPNMALATICREPSGRWVLSR